MVNKFFVTLLFASVAAVVVVVVVVFVVVNVIFVALTLVIDHIVFSCAQ